jgi:hypothetical protein
MVKTHTNLDGWDFLPQIEISALVMGSDVWFGWLLYFGNKVRQT